MLSPINNYLINLDGYKLMLVAPHDKLEHAKPHLLNISYSAAHATYEADGFTLRKAQSQKAGFHLLFEIFYKDNLLGHLYSAPTKNYGPTKSFRPVHLNHTALYTMDFAELIPKLMAAFDLRLHNHSFLHICLFTQQTDPASLIRIPEQLPDQFIRMNGIRVDTFSGTTYINKDSSRVVGVIYNKLEELRQLKKGKQKPYMLDWFVANGFDIFQPIYSFELKIYAKALTVYKALAVTEDGEEVSAYRANNNASTKTTRLSEKTKTDLDITKLQHPAYLATLFQKFLPIDIRKNDKSRPSNCTKIPLIDFGIYGPHQILQTVFLSVKPPTREKGIIKHHMQAFSETYAPSYLHVSVHLALKHKLVPYLFDLIAEKQIPWKMVEAARPSTLKGGEQQFVREIGADFNRLLHLGQ